MSKPLPALSTLHPVVQAFAAARGSKEAMAVLLQAKLADALHQYTVHGNRTPLNTLHQSQLLKIHAARLEDAGNNNHKAKAALPKVDRAIALGLDALEWGATPKGDVTIGAKFDGAGLRCSSLKANDAAQAVCDAAAEAFTVAYLTEMTAQVEKVKPSDKEVIAKAEKALAMVAALPLHLLARVLFTQAGQDVTSACELHKATAEKVGATMTASEAANIVAQAIKAARQSPMVVDGPTVCEEVAKDEAADKAAADKAAAKAKDKATA